MYLFQQWINQREQRQVYVAGNRRVKASWKGQSTSLQLMHPWVLISQVQNTHEQHLIPYSHVLLTKEIIISCVYLFKTSATCSFPLLLSKNHITKCHSSDNMKRDCKSKLMKRHRTGYVKNIVSTGKARWEMSTLPFSIRVNKARLGIHRCQFLRPSTNTFS